MRLEELGKLIWATHFNETVCDVIAQVHIPTLVEIHLSL
jgi:hypothetical protein